MTIRPHGRNPRHDPTPPAGHVRDAAADPGPRPPLRQRLAGFRDLARRAVALVWTTHPAATLAMAALTAVAGLLPAAIAYAGKLIVDAVVAAAAAGSSADLATALRPVALECALVLSLAAVTRALMVDESLLRALLGQRVNHLILSKALTLDLPAFEDPEIQDRMARARREASSRPLSLVRRCFGLVQNAISLVAYGGLLLAFSPVAVAVLVAAALPAFVAETRFSGQAFRLFSWRVPDTRQQAYLETVIAREDHAKEVMLFGLGPLLLGRYTAIFDRLFKEDRDLTLRRGAWGFVLGGLGTLAFYGAYAWIAVSAIRGQISLGDMTMYLAVFRQGQGAFAQVLGGVGGMYEDQLYLKNLFDFLEMETRAEGGAATGGPEPGDGIRFEDVTFTYPGAPEPAVRGVSLHLRPGRKLALVGENGSGKTTLIKLMTRLYAPDSGRILLDGLDLRAWDVTVLRRRIGVIFQDFVRYQLTAGENVGAGDVLAFEDEARQRAAAERGQALPFLERLPEGLRTQLGRWFRGGKDLSLGQWQKVALSRAFMREGADILVLDEPTASMDAEAEIRLFDHFREATRDQMAILISHRFSTVRMADEIVVLDHGRAVERGTHDELLALGGRYARLFTLQAAGYR